MTEDSSQSVTQVLAGVHPSYLPLINRSALASALHGVSSDIEAGTLEPPLPLVFDWLRYCAVDELVGVIVGQDPYPDGAVGLSFAKRREAGMTASFAPVVKCLMQSGRIAERKERHADLRPWAAQGILLANMALTTHRGTSKAHQKIWAPFTSALMTAIAKAAAQRGRRLFYMLWGTEAQRGIGPAATAAGHLVLTWTHPSPLSDNRLAPDKKFINCPHFVNADDAQRAAGRRAIAWDNAAPVVAFADGACLGNGGASARAGFGAAVVGAHFGRTTASGAVAASTYALIDPANPEHGFAPATATVAAPTNNRAELLALCWALLLLLRGCAAGSVTVYSDSQISVRTLNEWLPARRAKKKAHELANFDLVEIAEALLAGLRGRVPVVLVHINAAHDSKEPPVADKAALLQWRGNALVDKLAGEGLERPGAPPIIESPLPPVRAPAR